MEQYIRKQQCLAPERIGSKHIFRVAGGRINADSASIAPIWKSGLMIFAALFANAEATIK